MASLLNCFEIMWRLIFSWCQFLADWRPVWFSEEGRCLTKFIACGYKVARENVGSILVVVFPVANGFVMDSMSIHLGDS